MQGTNTSRLPGRFRFEMSNTLCLQLELSFRTGACFLPPSLVIFISVTLLRKSVVDVFPPPIFVVTRAGVVLPEDFLRSELLHCLEGFISHDPAGWLHESFELPLCELSKFNILLSFLFLLLGCICGLFRLRYTCFFVFGTLRLFLVLVSLRAG